MMLPLAPSQQAFLHHAEGGQAAAPRLSQNLSVGAQRIHDGLRQQVASGRRRVDVTGKRGGRQRNA